MPSRALEVDAWSLLFESLSFLIESAPKSITDLTSQVKFVDMSSGPSSARRVTPKLERLFLSLDHHIIQVFVVDKNL